MGRRSFATEGLVIAANGVGIFLGHGVAVGRLEGVRLSAAGKLAGELGAHGAERGEDAALHVAPLGGGPALGERSTQVVSVGADVGELLAEIGVVHELLNDAEAVGPVHIVFASDGAGTGEDGVVAEESIGKGAEVAEGVAAERAVSAVGEIAAATARAATAVAAGLAALATTLTTRLARAATLTRLTRLVAAALTGLA